MRTLPSQAELLRMFAYDPQTGDLRWRFRTDRSRQWNTRYAGRVITYRNDAGYICVMLKPHLLRAHRVIWKMATGVDPANEIDHRNLDRADNKWLNLREAEPVENKGNKAKQANNTSGFKGVFLDKRDDRWYSQICRAGVTYNLGRFATREEAHAAYAAAASQIYGEFGRAA